MEDEHSGIPSPPISCPPSPSSFTSDSFPSNLSASLFSLLSRSPGSPRAHFISAGFSSHEHPDSSRNLVIPSLYLGDALNHPNDPERHAATQTLNADQLGNINLLVIGKVGSGKSMLCESLLSGNEEVVHIGGWEDSVEGRVVTASTSTVDHHVDNVRIVRVPGWTEMEDHEAVLASLLHTIHTPFHQLGNLLNPEITPPSEDLLKTLLSSPKTPLYTTVIFVHSSPPTEIEKNLLSALAPVVPIVSFASHQLYPYHHHYRLSRQRSRPSSNYFDSLPHSRDSSRYGSRRMQSRPDSISRPRSPSRSLDFTAILHNTIFQPTDLHALRNVIFKSPESLSTLRHDALEKFLAWRSMERVVHGLSRTQLSSTRLDDSLTFEKFTFDQIVLGLEEEKHAQEDNSTPVASNVVHELGLSQAVALRKRHLVHRDTDVTIRLSPSESHVEDELIHIFRGRTETIRPRVGRPLVRVPLGSLPINEDAIFSSSEDASAPTSEYASAMSSRSTSPHERDLTPLSGPRFDSEASDMEVSRILDPRRGAGWYHGAEDLSASRRDPLHLPSVFNLAVSILPTLRRRMFDAINPITLIKRAFGGPATSQLAESDATVTSQGSTTSTGSGKGGGRSLIPSLILGLTCFCVGIGWGVALSKVGLN